MFNRKGNKMSDTATHEVHEADTTHDDQWVDNGGRPWAEEQPFPTAEDVQETAERVGPTDLTPEQAQLIADQVRKEVSDEDVRRELGPDFLGVMIPPGEKWSGEGLDPSNFFLVHFKSMDMLLDAMMEVDGLRKGMRTINKKRKKEQVNLRRTARRLVQARAGRDKRDKTIGGMMEIFNMLEIDPNGKQ